jgi:hypothetical protein
VESLSPSLPNGIEVGYSTMESTLLSAAIEAEISYVEVSLPHGYTYISPFEYELDEYSASI